MYLFWLSYSAPPPSEYICFNYKTYPRNDFSLIVIAPQLLGYTLLERFWQILQYVQYDDANAKLCVT